MHKFDVHDESWFRYMKYYDEFNEEEKKVTKDVWLGGHADFGSLTLLFSQPMASLQVRRESDQKWQYVKHVPGAMIVNAGQFMSWFTGDFFKAAIHRVNAPPKDQRNYERCGVFYFVVPNDDVVCGTQMQSPVLQRNGIKPRPDNEVTTSKVYSQARIKSVGKTPVSMGGHKEGEYKVELVGGVSMRFSPSHVVLGSEANCFDVRTGANQVVRLVAPSCCLVAIYVSLCFAEAMGQRHDLFSIIA